MPSIIFIVAFVWVAVKILIWGIKVTWKIEKDLLVIILVPLFIIGQAGIGLVNVSIAILIIDRSVALVEAWLNRGFVEKG